MKERNVTITLSKAREWLNSGDATLREVALQAFSKDELVCSFKSITTFKEACEVLGLDYITRVTAVGNIAYYSKSSAAAFKLNIIRKALNLGVNLHFVENPRNSYIYCPNNPFIAKVEGFRYYKNEINSGTMEIIGEIRSEGASYYVLNSIAYFNGIEGLGNFNYSTYSGRASADSGFLGCASKEIAEHFGKYFGMLITEAKYADIVKDFEIVESKYAI